MKPEAQIQTEWQVQTAKARFSEVFRKARTEGPQRITRQGKEAVVMLPEEQYRELTKDPPKYESFHDFLRASPLVGVKLDLRRNKSRSRDIQL